MKTTLHTTMAEDIGNGMKKTQCKDAVELLASVLCNQHVLYIKTRNFHWNLKGPRFHGLHVFFETQYQELETAIDATAERIRMIGGVAPGSMAEFLSGADLKEAASEIISGDGAISALVADHDQVVRDLREKIPQCEDEFNDVGTADFLTDLLRDHEQTAWMLRSFLE